MLKLLILSLFLVLLFCSPVTFAQTQQQLRAINNILRQSERLTTQQDREEYKYRLQNSNELYSVEDAPRSRKRDSATVDADGTIYLNSELKPHSANEAGYNLLPASMRYRLNK